MKAIFTPQAWIRDNATDVDCEGENTWVPSDAHVITLLRREAAKGLSARTVFQENTDASDGLRDDPAAPEWVRNWRGPFYVTVEVSDEEIIGLEKAALEAAES
jgi:hypothetical protein